MTPPWFLEPFTAIAVRQMTHDEDTRLSNSRRDEFMDGVRVHGW